MPSEIKKEIELEIAHVLFIDIVDYSKLLINEQRRSVETLNRIVRGTEQFRIGEENGRLVTVPTGDGMALVFYNTPEAPVECALEISRALKENPELKVRMGVHSGPVSGVIDVSGRANIAGAGINVAQRVMDCGDAGHILLSKHVAEDLQHYSEWYPYLHDVGQCEVKHGEIISIVNLYTSELGNPEPPRLKRSQVEVRRRRRNALLFAGSSLVVLAAVGLFLLPRASARKIDKSIAVLPFQSLSDEKENAYFADGIQDDILTNLSKIGDLKVISRMSVMSYRGDALRNAREIGKALGVGTLLEGSVRRIGNRVRVSVQLINANNDEHLWAEDYDRDLTDVFAIQTDLAQKIASALQAKLSPDEKERLDRQPTKDPNAYLLFIQAHDYANRPDHFRDDSLKAEELFEQAIKLDPKFASAFAGLSMVESWMYHSFEPTPARREKARLNADESLRLQPNLPEGHLALGFSYYYGDRDYERALTEFEIAKRDLPNEAQAYMAIGAIQRRQGKWAESTANLEKAAALDPKNASILVNLAYSYMALRNFEAADKTVDRAIAVAPQSFATVGLKAYLAAAWRGDLSLAETQFSAISPEVDPNGLVTWVRSGMLMWQRKFPEALAVVQKFPGETLVATTTAPVPKAFLEGTIHFLEGDKPTSQIEFEKARVVSEKLLRDAPEDPARHAQHGLILAALGQKEEAIKEGKKAVELLPESRDAFDGPQFTASLAQIYAWTGESDEALRLIDHLLGVPNGLAVPILKIDPAWDPLRKDPRFQALIDKYAAKR
jgi:serine/threonine-protein kinase